MGHWRRLGGAAIVIATVALALGLFVGFGAHPGDDLALYALRAGHLAALVAIAAFLADRSRS